MPDEFDKVIFPLAPGTVSKIVRTQYGYHIFLVEEKILAHQQKLFKVEDQIKEKLLLERQRAALAGELASLAQRIPIQVDRERLEFKYTGARLTPRRDNTMKKFLWLSGTLLIFASVLTSQTNPVKIVDRIVARVNDDIITQSDVNREMIQYRQELAQKFTGEQLDQEMKKAEKEVLKGLIRDKLFLQKAQELGIGSGMDVQVSAEIERMRKQYNIKDMEEFEKALEAQGMTLAGYREYVKKQMIIGSLIGEFVNSRITLLTEEVERYYKDHAKDFSSPEEVTLSEILIPTSGDDGQPPKPWLRHIASAFCRGSPLRRWPASTQRDQPQAKAGASVPSRWQSSIPKSPLR